MRIIFILYAVEIVFAGRIDWSEEKDASFWNNQARQSIEEILKRQKNIRRAKNVILFIGDGMGITTVTGGRIRKGQVNGQLGEDFVTEMEQFPYTGFAKTYNIDTQTPDSAATATAYLCGVKAQLGTIGVDGRVSLGSCTQSKGAHVSSILTWAQDEGKKVGIVTTARITHATPAAAYAHSANREWELYDDKLFGRRHVEQGCLDIAHQLMLHSPPIDLIFGGGRKNFYPKSIVDVEYPNVTGSRTDNRSLVDEYWKGEFIWNKSSMKNLQFGSSKPILGLFERGHMYFESDRADTKNDEPSLSEMTQFALEHFSQFNQGFFLLIEGAKIDLGHHITQPRYALDDFVEFDNAIGLAKNYLKQKNLLDETLIVITADHSHVFTIGSYSARGSNILGFTTVNKYNASDVDRLPINIITYGNGPNFNSSRNATYLFSLNTNLTNYRSPTALPMKDESHGAEDVPVYAQGPWSHLFVGTMEQHTIAHKMAYAACWGAYRNRDGCRPIKLSTATVQFNRSCSIIPSQFIQIIFFLLSSFFIYK